MLTRPMLTRRALVAAAAATPWLPRAARAAEKLTFCSWGGALSELEKSTLLDPFARQHGIEMTYTSPTSYAKLKAMVEAGSPEWDLVDVGGRFIFEGADLIEPLDLALIPNAALLDPGWVTPRGIFTSSGATVLAWNTKAFPADHAPQDWKDFWDVKTFPGARGLYKPFYYNYEIALLADGVPRGEIYPVTDEKAQRALAKLRELKPHVAVWWTAGAQPPQLLSSGELALAAAWSGRISAIMKDQAPVSMTLNDGIAWGNAWVIPKGSPNARTAMAAIDGALAEEAQTRLAATGVYGPVLPAAAAKATPEQQGWMTTSAQNRSRMLIINEQQAALYSQKYQAEWAKFQLD